MRTVNYITVIRAAEALYAGTRDDLATLNDQALNAHFDRWARQAWEAYFWPEWTLAERRQFRPDWDTGTTYGAPTATAAVERYHVRSRKYYQSLRAANTGNAPADADGVENSAWWAECASDYGGLDWATGMVFTVTNGSATIVRNPEDDRFYQCHTAHTAGATFDSTKFGVLTPFRRSVDYEQTDETEIGAVKAIWDRDPRVYFGNARPIEFVLADKVYVAGSEQRVWVEFRERPPSWSGDDWLAATTFALDAQCYSPTQGNFYKSLQAANTNHAVTDTAWWEVIPVPYVLQDAIAQGILSELLETDEKPEWAATARAKASRLAEQEFTKISRQQAQGVQLPMRR